MLTITSQESSWMATATMPPGTVKDIVARRDCEVRVLIADAGDTLPRYSYDVVHRTDVVQGSQPAGTQYDVPYSVPPTFVCGSGQNRSAALAFLSSMIARVSSNASSYFT